MVALAEKINADGLALYKDVYNLYGTAGTTPSTLADLAGSAKILNDNKAPLVGRSAVWNTEAIANFQQLPALVNAEKSGSTDALREGSIGRVFGVDHFFSQQIPAHSAGYCDSPMVLHDWYNDEGTEIELDGGVGVLYKGDILMFNGKPQVVQKDVEFSGNRAKVSVLPGVPEEDRNEGDAVLLESHAVNLMFQKNAFGFVTRPLEEARGADSYVTHYNGLSVRVTMDYNIATKKQTLSIDTLYGFKTLYPELAVRVLG